MKHPFKAELRVSQNGQLVPSQSSFVQKSSSKTNSHFNKIKLMAILFLMSFGAFASHYRYGVVTATRLSETSTTVTYRINVNEAWRLGAAPGVATYTISGGNSSNLATSLSYLNVLLTNVTDPSGGWTNSAGAANVTLNKSATPTTLQYTSCCKIGNLANNANGNWDEKIVLYTNLAGSSPVSSMPAIINMPAGASAATYLVPANDPDAGSTLTFAATPVSGSSNPSGFSINSTTGQITMSTIGKSVGQLYNARISITDNQGNTIFLDFIINIVGSSNPPVFDYTVTPANGSIYNVIAGQTLSFPIKATDPDAGSTVSMSAAGLPSYITTSNFSSAALPALGNPSSTNFSWTPAAAQIGTNNVLTFIATDNVGVQTTTSVTIKVVAEPAPTFIAPTPAAGSIRQIMTGTLHQDEIKAQSSLGSNVSISFATIPSGASMSPSIPTTGANPGVSTLSWTPVPANFGVHNLSYTASITAFPTIFTTRSYQLIVNTAPVFTSTPTGLSFTAGTPFTYNITVSDPNIPYGDVVDIIGAVIPSWLTLTDNGNGTATLTGTPSLADIGVHEVHIEAEDTYHHGNPNHVEQEFEITVLNPCTPVSFTNCPSNLNENTTSTTCDASVSYGLTTAGTATSSVSYVLTGATTGSGNGTGSGSTFNKGITTVTVTAVNPCGTATCSFTVTVTDATNPTAVAQNVGVSLSASGTATVDASDVNNGSSDNCGIASISLSKTSFDCSNVGANNVTLTVLDVNGNSSTANAVVTVTDNINPTALAKNVSVSLSAAGTASITASDVNNGSSDNCGIASISLSKTSFDCSNVGANNVTLTVLDVNGNSSTANAVVTVTDNINPTAVCKNAIVTLSNGSASITAADINNGSSDACGIATLSVSPSTFTCANIGNNNVVLTVTDVNGNVSTCNATVQVLGSVPSCSVSSSPRNNGPVIGSTTTLAAANTLYLGYGAQTMNLTCTASGAAPFTYSWSGSNLSATNIANPIFAPTTGGNYTFTCTVTNAFGCQTTCSIVICVLDIRSTGGSPSNPKVYLCHVPPGNPNNPQTLNISISAVPAHLGNHAGDRLGSCTQTCGSLKNNAAIGDLYTDGEVDLIVYPNPSTSSFTFKLESESNEPIQISILDINGRLITTTEFNSSSENMVVGDDLANGIYVAMVKQGNFSKTVKIQKLQ